MKITKPFLVIATIICMLFMNVAMAKPDPIKKILKRIDRVEVRVAELETLVTGLQAQLDVVEPDGDLTGKTFCVFGQGSWLFAEENVSAQVIFNPFHARLEFTSPTAFTVTTLYDPITSLLFGFSMPFFPLVDDEDVGDGVGTYTVVGNRLTLISDEVQTFYITGDARVLVGGFFERAMDGDLETWETGIIVGVQTTSTNCT